jgi:hypothetical protein
VCMRPDNYSSSKIPAGGSYIHSYIHTYMTRMYLGNKSIKYGEIKD